MKPYIFVFIGGGFGSMLRFIIGLIFQKTKLTLPWSTFISNIIACLIFSLVLLLSQYKLNLAETFKYLLLIGFCGGLSTFSTFSYENYLLLKQSAYLVVALNVILTTGLCIFIFYWLVHSN